MRRREFIVLGVGAAVARSIPARAQASGMPVIGFLGISSADTYEIYVKAFRDGLKEAGYVDGQNVGIQFRWAEGHYGRLPALAVELVHYPVALIVASGGAAVALAARAAGPTMPIVFSSGTDPVKDGLVASFNQPGGYTTGVFLITHSLVAKRVELLRELMPKAATVAFLSNPTNPNANNDIEEAEGAARAQGLHLLSVKARTKAELDGVFTALAEGHAEGLVVEASPVFTSERAQLVALAARYAIPTIYEWQDFAVAGGLMSYGTSLTGGYHQAGIYAGRILKGEKPGDLPVVQLSKVDLVINLKAAKLLGLTVPESILGRADEVIE